MIDKQFRTLGERPMKRITQDEWFQRIQRDMAERQAVAQEEPAAAVVCPVCMDRGWIGHPTEDITHPMFGRVIRCPRKCDAQMANQERASRYRVAARDALVMVDRKIAPVAGTLADYQPRTGDQEFAYKCALALVENGQVTIEGKSKKSIVFVGAIGSGKTFLSSAVTNTLAEMERDVLYIKFGEMIRRVNACHDENVPVNALDVIHALQYVDLLVVDDVKRDNATPATRDLFFDVIDARYDANLSTVLTTNLTPRQMADQLGEAATDRLIHIAHWVRMDGHLRDDTGVL